MYIGIHKTAEQRQELNSVLPSLDFPARKLHFIFVSNHCCFSGISKPFTQSLCLYKGQRHKDRNEQPGTGDPQRPSSHTILPGHVSSSAQLPRQSFHLPALIPSTFQSLPEHPPSLLLSQRSILGSGVV